MGAAKDSNGLGTARLTIVIAPGQSHNKVSKVEPEVIFVDVGAGKGRGKRAQKKAGAANVELLGFLASIFELREEQVRLESGAEQNGKVVVLSGLKQEKRELIWRLERLVGKRHEPHFAVDDLNDARQSSNKQAVARQKELDEFQNLQDEARALATKPVMLGGIPKLKGAQAQPPAGRGKRSGAGADEPDPKRPAIEEAGAAPTTAQESAKIVAPAVDAAASGEEEPGLGGLAAYDSEDDESDDDDRPALPQPVL